LKPMPAAEAAGLAEESVRTRFPSLELAQVTEVRWVSLDPVFKEPRSRVGLTILGHGRPLVNPLHYHHRPSMGATRYAKVRRLSTPLAARLGGASVLTGHPGPVVSGVGRRELGGRWAGGPGKERKGGRAPRQGRHVLAGTLDRMEGASLRGPEALPPQTFLNKVGDPARRHREGAGSFFHLAGSVSLARDHASTPPGGDFGL